jgi:hypothetical protein
VISFPLSDLDGFQKWLRAGFTKGAMRGAYSVALRTVEVITTELIPAENPPPVFMRAYAAGWRAVQTKEGASIVNTVPYAAVIEYGARPENIKVGKAMIEALQKWVLVKGLVGKPGKSGSSKRASQEVEARNVAWAIAMHMKKVGIFNREGKQGLRIGEKAMAKARTFAGPEILKEVMKELSS